MEGGRGQTLASQHTGSKDRTHAVRCGGKSSPTEPFTSLVQTTATHTLRKQPECLVGTGQGKHPEVSQLLFPLIYRILKSLVGKCGYLVLSTYCTHSFNKYYIGVTNCDFSH